MARLHLRVKLGNVTLFGMFSHTQTLRGVTNKIGKDKYFLMWDLENCTLQEATKSLLRIQNKYGLSDIFIVSDRDMSYRAYCYNIVNFKRFLMILCDTEYIDWNFIRWSVVRGEATLRTCRKQNRPQQRLVSVLQSYSMPILKDLKNVVYDTGRDKRGKVLHIDVKKGVVKVNG